MALTGNETLEVRGQLANGAPSGETFQTSTREIAGAVGARIPVTRPTNGNFDTTTFAKYFPFSAWRTVSGTVQTNFDWGKWAPNSAFYASNAATYYVSTTGNDSNTGASWAQAFLSINKAIAVGNAAAVPYLVYIAAGTYQFYFSFGDASGATVPSQSCAFIAKGGRVVSTMSVPDFQTTWGLDTGTTYKVTGSLIGGPTKMQRVVALDLLDQYGDYTEWQYVATPALCRTTLGSWSVDGTTIYVNRSDGAACTTANTRMFYNSQNGPASTTSGNMYCEGIDFEGGNLAVMTCQSNVNGRMVFNNCSFKWSSNLTASSDNTVVAYNVDGVALINCTLARGQNDGLASHVQSAKTAFIIQINGCTHHMGSPYAKGIGGVSTSCNAITTHDSGRSVSINSVMHHCAGGTSAHVLGAQHWSVGDYCYSSAGDLAQGGSAPPSDWFSDQNTPTNTAVWVDGGASYSGDNTTANPYYFTYTDNIGGAGANVFYRNCSFNGRIGNNSTEY